VITLGQAQAMSRQTQTSRMAAEGGLGSLPDTRKQTKRRSDKQEAPSKMKAVPPTQEEVDAAAKEKYEPQVKAYVDQLEKDRDEKIAKIQRDADHRIAEAEKKNDAAAREKIAKIQRDADEKIAKAEKKMNLRRGIAEGEAWLNDARSDATGLDSVATSGGRDRKKYYKDSATGKMVPERTLPEALSNDNMLFTWYTGSSARFDQVDVEFPAGDGKVQIVTMSLLLCRAPTTESGSFLCYDINGNRVHCKTAGPYRQPAAVTLESIHNIPAFKKALDPVQEVDDLFKGLKVRMAEGRRSDGASSASTDNNGR